MSEGEGVSRRNVWGDNHILWWIGAIFLCIGAFTYLWSGMFGHYRVQTFEIVVGVVGFILAGVFVALGFVYRAIGELWADSVRREAAVRRMLELRLVEPAPWGLYYEKRFQQALAEQAFRIDDVEMRVTHLDGGQTRIRV